MRANISKSVPNPHSFNEILRHYWEHLVKYLLLYYREKIRDPFAKKHKKKFAKIRKLKNASTGKIAFVLASGPSINKLDPNKLKSFSNKNDCDFFCVNYFINSDFAKVIGIDYWLLSDPRHFDSSIPDSKRGFENAGLLVRKGILASEFYFSKAEEHSYLPVIPFNDKENSILFSKNIDPTRPRAFISMSAYKALAIAGYMGYEQIYICGFDNSFIKDFGCDENNQVYRSMTHFYSKSSLIENEVARDYIMGTKRQNRNMAEEMLASSRLFSDLYLFKKFPIVNLDPDSLTDAFPKSVELDIYKN